MVLTIHPTKRPTSRHCDFARSQLRKPELTRRRLLGRCAILARPGSFAAAGPIQTGELRAIKKSRLTGLSSRPRSLREIDAGPQKVNHEPALDLRPSGS